MSGLSVGLCEEIMALALIVLIIQYQSVTCGQTDRRTDIAALAIAALALLFLFSRTGNIIHGKRRLSVSFHHLCDDDVIVLKTLLM